MPREALYRNTCGNARFPEGSDAHLAKEEMGALWRFQSLREPVGHVQTSVGVHDGGPESETLCEREASHRSQDKDARRISVGQCGIIRDDRDALAKPRRLERGRIEDVMVAYAVLEEKSFVIA